MNTNSEITCSFCKNQGHKYSECSKIKNKICHICESTTHLAPECQENDGLYLCKLCGRTGHYSKYCRWIK